METLLKGRRVWLVYEPMVKDGMPLVTDVIVTGIRRVLPAGPVAVGEAPSREGHRIQHLVQLYTDPGGLRTLAVADIQLKDPRRRNTAA